MAATQRTANASAAARVSANLLGSAVVASMERQPSIKVTEKKGLMNQG